MNKNKSQYIRRPAPELTDRELNEAILNELKILNISQETLKSKVNTISGTMIVMLIITLLGFAAYFA